MSYAKPVSLLLGIGSKSSAFHSSSQYTGRQLISGCNGSANPYGRSSESIPSLSLENVTKQSESGCVKESLYANVSKLCESSHQQRNSLGNVATIYPQHGAQSSNNKLCETTTSSSLSSRVEDATHLVDKTSQTGSSSISVMSIPPRCNRHIPSFTPPSKAHSYPYWHQRMPHHGKSLTSPMCRHYTCSNIYYRTNQSHQPSLLSKNTAALPKRHRTWVHSPLPKIMCHNVQVTERGVHTTHACLSRSSNCTTKTKLTLNPSQICSHGFQYARESHVPTSGTRPFLSQYCHTHQTQTRSIHTAGHPVSKDIEITPVDKFEGGPSLTQVTAYLKSFKCDYKIGFTCIKLPCPFCDDTKVPADVKVTTKKGARIRKEVKGVYINKTTGKIYQILKIVKLSLAALFDDIDATDISA